ncbi:Ferredoxin subunit of nitrite reductase or a ring-hydroxylating dioxygenase [Marinobacter gudaonensis]|uniref:Ferredoxin subunit of nitrite reductase or a ring-hydroxylating dioxygenase n=1 Tax=Marinobacter gudaonensis TaxID=375760 RepID=A0A1I6HAG6_9GAMM|nr:Rieske 2Fe-2S domain-containing protein [Marinobacter gudaonensis]SFR51311.1 Ferredoxin subunit of nitrite reductase or a ring-hydroxylating dioxygenase [Marinobacter gudaonensis]
MTANISQWQPVCRAPELVPGRFVEFRLREKARQPEGMPLTGFLFLDGGEPRAYLNVCPHLGIELNWMPGRFMDSDNLFIQCSTHGALFKPGDGECIAGPCQGDALTQLEVREHEGQLEVRLPE